MTRDPLGFPTAPFIDADSGDIAEVWRMWLLNLRALQQGGTLGGPGTPVTITPPATSPMTFAASANGTLFVSGGGVEQMTISRRGGTAYPVGQFYGGTPLRAGDVLTIRFLVPPRLVFFPG